MKTLPKAKAHLTLSFIKLCVCEQSLLSVLSVRSRKSFIISPIKERHLTTFLLNKRHQQCNFSYEYLSECVCFSYFSSQKFFTIFCGFCIIFREREKDLEGSYQGIVHSLWISYVDYDLKIVYNFIIIIPSFTENDTFLSMLNKILRLFSSSSSSGSHHFIFQIYISISKKKINLMRKEWVRCVWGYLLIKSTSSHNLLLRKFPLARERY